MHIRQLTSEELFKAMIVHDTSLHVPVSVVVASRGQQAAVAQAAATELSRIRQMLRFISLPSVIDYPVSQPTLVRFDETRPPVRLSHAESDIERAIQSHSFGHYHLRLNEIHDATRPPATTNLEAFSNWFSQLSYSTRLETARHVAQEASQARNSAQQWAFRLAARQTGARVVEAEIDKSLTNTWRLWNHGFIEATGYAMAALDRTKLNVFRRRRR
ncbi:hypothetical protein EX895_002790 [Sporisorium graminicola]|uniref:Uncharacterized protein n=1 Tax=Sporisorium graminicola TaxID=280036 RepID=A0A4U7KYE0_9BASI|nr:hypothetical protein EX895_002790 [Sporisorium graminicola]TKY88438.1 hypothetical protein EX895_002790 [Sporisorium graminicola]